jgi:oligopeptide transport system substrate-binding protein
MIKRGIIIKSLVLTFALLIMVSSASGCRAFQTTLDNIDLQSASGGTLNLWDDGPRTLDPAISSEMASHVYVMQIFSGLVKFDTKLNPAPDLAESWEVSPDGKTYTFHLRKDARFQDGRKLTSSDIKYSLERACNPATASPTASTYLNDIVGAAEVISGKAPSISGINIIDDSSFTITIDAPKTYFLSKLAYPTAFVVDRKNAEQGGEWWRKPNGTGPYKLAKWDDGSLIALQPNQYYSGEKATVRVLFHILAGYPMSLYETGKIDIAQVSAANIDKAMDETGPFYDQLQVSPEFSLRFIGFNTAKAPFDDPYVRQAFSHAVNKARIIKILQKEMVTEAKGVIPAGMPGYNKDLNGLGYDPAIARELLGKSKYSGGLPPITMTVVGNGGVMVDPYIGAVIQDLQQNLGADIRIRLLDPVAFNHYLGQEVDEMYDFGWIADYPDPQNFLGILFRSGSEFNTSHFSSKELDDLLDRAAVEQDFDKRMALYGQAEQVVVQQAPVIPLWFQKNYILVNPGVHNFQLDPLGVPRLNLVTLDK